MKKRESVQIKRWSPLLATLAVTDVENFWVHVLVRKMSSSGVESCDGVGNCMQGTSQGELRVRK
jgi:hypothetical protein